MGFFNKKPSEKKVYSLQEAMKKINENSDYSVVETQGGFRLIHDSKIKSQIESIKKENEFRKRISGDGKYQNLSIKTQNNFKDINNTYNMNIER